MIEMTALHPRAANQRKSSFENTRLAVAICAAPSTPRLVRTLEVLARSAPSRLSVFVPGSERVRAIAALDRIVDPSNLKLRLVGDEAGSPVIASAIHHLGAADDTGTLFVLDEAALPQPEWIGASLEALAQGADAVAANATANPAPCALDPQQLGPRDLALRYGQLVRKFEEQIDPDPDDPAPRHGDNSGTGLAVTLGALRRAGGMPDVPNAPGRHLLARLRFAGGVVRHDPRARVAAPDVRPSIPWLIWPADGTGLSALGADAPEVERAFRLRADLRARLARQHAGLPPLRRARAIRADLALATPFLPVPASPVPLREACEHLKERLPQLAKEGHDAALQPLPNLVAEPGTRAPGFLPSIPRSGL